MTSKKDFAGQYSGEQLLFRSSESLGYTIIEHFGSAVTVFVFAIIIYYIGTAVSSGIILPIVISFVPIVAYIWYIRYIHHLTYFIITSRRVIKGVKKNLFVMHKRELPLERIEQLRSENNSYFDAIFGYGNIHLTSSDLDSSMYFRGLPYHHEVVAYLSRVVEHVKVNGKTDGITPFKTRKERYREKVKM